MNAMAINRMKRWSDAIIAGTRDLTSLIPTTGVTIKQIRRASIDTLIRRTIRRILLIIWVLKRRSALGEMICNTRCPARMELQMPCLLSIHGLADSLEVTVATVVMNRDTLVRRTPLRPPLHVLRFQMTRSQAIYSAATFTRKAAPAQIL